MIARVCTEIFSSVLMASRSSSAASDEKRRPAMAAAMLDVSSGDIVFIWRFTADTMSCKGARNAFRSTTQAVLGWPLAVRCAL